jgi:hypothetical protein
VQKARCLLRRRARPSYTRWNALTAQGKPLLETAAIGGAFVFTVALDVLWRRARAMRAAEAAAGGSVRRSEII